MKRGFTLIEILVTIAIIIVLVGIVMFGMSTVGDASKSNAVKATLGNLRGMIAELEAKTGLASRQPLQMWDRGSLHPGAKPLAPPPEMAIWEDATPSSDATDDPLYVPDAPVTREAGTARYMSDAVANTQIVMGLLLALPANKSMVGQLPQEQLMERVPNPPTSPKIEIDASNRAPVPSLVLDSWGNPILFVPGAGLCGNDSAGADDSMWIGGRKGEDGARQVVQNPSASQSGPIRSPDGRPFWASAGPDGDFRTGDDNVYSFN